MSMRLYRTPHGPLVEERGQFYSIESASWDALITRDDLYAHLGERLGRAKAIKREALDDPSGQVELAFRLTTGRAPTDQEKRLGVEFLKQQPLKEFALAMFNLNAFLYVN